MPIQQSLCIPCFYDDNEDLGEFLDYIKVCGFSAAEIWGRSGFAQFDEFCDGMHQRDLCIASMAGHGSIASGLNDPEQHQRIEDELIASIDVAVEHKIPSLICFSGERLSGHSDQQGMEICAQGIKRVIPYAEDKGINLNLELLNSKIDHANYLGDHFDWGLAFCEMVASPRCKLLFDIYHMQIMDGDIIRNIQKGIQHIGHFHTAGNPGRHDLDEQQEINYRAICHAITATDYTGYVGHEFWTTGDDKRTALQAAYAVCDI
ncbi:MAG: TIM barrel protein [Planctomycetes bacterium]|nr:TIM barrel protein [Planctomycetota bacterium]